MSLKAIFTVVSAGFDTGAGFSLDTGSSFGTGVGDPHDATTTAIDSHAPAVAVREQERYRGEKSIT